MRFTKMHGLGNDFLVVDDREPMPVDWAALARRLCHRRRGVGADGILLVQHSATADLRMRLFNADGSEAEMCGNGIRCLALLACRRGWARTITHWETGAGTVTTEVVDEDEVTVTMGHPRFTPAEIPVEATSTEVDDLPLTVADTAVRGNCVGMGNPHCVIVVGDVDAVDVARLGPAVERHPRFPRRTNVEFVEVVGPDRIRQRTWERGVGETDACGTGACAAVVAVQRRGLVGGGPVTVELRGGLLVVEWRAPEPVRLRGPAVEVFSGEVEPLPSEVRPAAGEAA